MAENSRAWSQAGPDRDGAGVERRAGLGYGRLDFAEAKAVAHTLELAGNRETKFLGSWHTHPNRRGEPSVADRQAAACSIGGLRHSGLGHVEKYSTLMRRSPRCLGP